METTTNYQIITDAVIADLQTLIIAQIALGWTPIGGIAYDSSDYSQAMVKVEGKEVTEYTVIHHNDKDTFIAAVENMLALGWTLYGSKQGTGAGGYEQAFIKY